MSSRAPDMLSSIFSTGQRPQPPGLVRGMIPMKVPGRDDRPAFTGPEPRRRTAIWEMHPSVHCSIIGTCLSCGELRRLLIKLGVHGADTVADHDLHKQGVTLAGQPQSGGRLIQKALDRRHEAAVRHFAKAKDEAALRQLWDEAVKSGDIPGAYWAVLSHPAATDAIMRKVFGDVHMLSHMVGAANRADIRRLRQLELANEALTETLELQQRQLRSGFTERDQKIRLLNDALGRALAQAPSGADTESDDARAAREALIDMERRLSRETVRRERLEGRLQAAEAALAVAERARREAERKCDALGRELACLEARLDGWLGEGAQSAIPDLGGAHVLYVGGRTRQVPQLKTLVERSGAAFLHHDGGIEHSKTLLPGLISRADCAMFPIDCISHDAMGTLKRLCRQSAKPFVPLRTSSLACLLSGLAMLEPMRQRASAD